jgi:hypothetical protein
VGGDGVARSSLETRSLQLPGYWLYATTAEANAKPFIRSVESPATGGRGFIIDRRIGFGGERTIAAILAHTGGWTWQPIKDLDGRRAPHWTSTLGTTTTRHALSFAIAPPTALYAESVRAGAH